jgi:hypothetical protein
MCRLQYSLESNEYNRSAHGKGKWDQQQVRLTDEEDALRIRCMKQRAKEDEWDTISEQLLQDYRRWEYTVGVVLNAVVEPEVFADLDKPIDYN